MSVPEKAPLSYVPVWVMVSDRVRFSVSVTVHLALYSVYGI